MIKNNIKTLRGTLFINSKDGVEYVGCYEYLRLLQFQKQDSIQPIQQTILDTYGDGIKEETINKFIEILSEQKWSTGMCHGQKVKSAYDFTIVAIP